MATCFFISFLLVILFLINGLDCFIYVEEELTWLDARDHCRDLGSDLATILTQQELDDALQFLDPTTHPHAWIGLNNNIQTNQWSWSDDQQCFTTDGCTQFWSPRVVSNRHCAIIHLSDIQNRRLFVAEENSEGAAFAPEDNSEDAGFTPMQCEESASFLCNEPSIIPIHDTDHDITTTPPPDDDDTTSPSPTLAPTLYDDDDYVLDDEYIYVSDPYLSWSDANNYCKQNYDTNLATLTTKEDLDNAQSLIQQSNEPRGFVWIGLYTQHKIGWWKWLDGEKCDNEHSGACVHGRLWIDDEPRCLYALDKAKRGYNCSYFSTELQKFDNHRRCEVETSFLCNLKNKFHDDDEDDIANANVMLDGLKYITNDDVAPRTDIRFVLFCMILVISISVTLCLIAEIISVSKNKTKSKTKTKFKSFKNEPLSDTTDEESDRCQV